MQPSGPYSGGVAEVSGTSVVRSCNRSEVILLARMIPNYVPEGRKYSAEKALFGLLSRGLGPEWFALHSVEFAEAAGKSAAEIDFVLIGPSGIFAIEAKGGYVEQEEGVWYSRDRKNERHPIHNPYAQARDNWHQLRRWTGRSTAGNRARVGYGVAFPHCNFKSSLKEKRWSPDMPEEITLDRGDAAHEVLEWVQRLDAFARARPGGERGAHLDFETCEAIVEELRPNFTTRSATGGYFDDVVRDLDRTARNQFDAASGGIRNAERAIIRGGPGTGKSVLALKEAQHWGNLAHRGLPVVLTCFNHALAEDLARRLADDAPDVRVAVLHDLMKEAVQNAGKGAQLRDEDSLDRDEKATYFREELPSLAIAALSSGTPEREGVYQLIIDEGQDLLEDRYIDFMDVMLDAGVSGGRWRLFIDPAQDAYRQWSTEGFTRFDVSKSVEYELLTNCRNPDRVAAGASILAGDDLCGARPLVSGGTFEPKYFEWTGADGEETLSRQRALVEESIESLLQQGVEPRNIVLLSPFRLEKSLAMRDIVRIRPVHDVGRGEAPSVAGSLAFSTIYSFKGLQAQAVIILDITASQRRKAPALLRIGASRAQVHLVAMLEESLREPIEAATRAHEATCPHHRDI